MTPNDLTLIEGIVVFLHTLTATAYLVLSWAIYTRKKYLKWNKHIYPVTMYGSLLLAIALYWLLSTYYFFDIKKNIAWMMIFIFIGMDAICYSVAAEANRLAHKFDRLEIQEKEITHLKGIIENLKKNRIVLLLIGLFFLVNCGGLKKELNKVTEESKAKTERYEKQLSEKDEKIKEIESRETETNKKLKLTENERNTIKKERDQLKETIDKMDKSDFVIKDAVGTVKMTDAKGNQYEIQSGKGTEISNRTESILKSTLERVAESLHEQTQKVKNLTSDLFTKDRTIKEKEAEIRLIEEQNKKLAQKTKELSETVQKSKTKEGISVFWWIGLGVLIPILLQLAWKIYKPNIF